MCISHFTNNVSCSLERLQGKRTFNLVRTISRRRVAKIRVRRTIFKIEWQKLNCSKIKPNARPTVWVSSDLLRSVSCPFALNLYVCLLPWAFPPPLSSWYASALLPQEEYWTFHSEKQGEIMLKFFLCYITPNVTTLHKREVERDSPCTDVSPPLRLELHTMATTIFDWVWSKQKQSNSNGQTEGGKISLRTNVPLSNHVFIKKLLYNLHMHQIVCAIKVHLSAKKVW